MDAPKFRTTPKVHEPKGLFFGKSGTGKTSVALSTGKPTVLINTDNGAEEILSQQKRQTSRSQTSFQQLLDQEMRKRIRQPGRPTARHGLAYSTRLVACLKRA